MNDPYGILRGIYAIIAALAIWYRVYDGNARERGGGFFENGMRYVPYIDPWLLPLCLAMMVPMLLLLVGPEITTRQILSICFVVFLHISIYYAVLMVLLPLLRKYVSARVCATLWLLPNYLYVVWHPFMERDGPDWIITVNSTVLSVICIIWFIGFVAVLGQKIVSHLRFRRAVLDSAWDARGEVLALWLDELERANMEDKGYRLVQSGAVKTPLSIGFFASSTVVVLPDREYTRDELALIFRHEIIHIGRKDSGTKFFLAFCTAMCWFNPLMWMAMRRSADDLELSCDETVLLETDSETRRRYADLLLRTAGDERGFTTCLAVSADSMRYRLKNTVVPRKRLAGGLLAGGVLAALLLSCGHVAMAYDAGTGLDLIYYGQDPATYVSGSVSYNKGDGWVSYTCGDDAALAEYLADLELYHITGNYGFYLNSDMYQPYLTMYYQTEQGGMYLYLTDEYLSVNPLYSSRGMRGKYYIREDVDWVYIESLLEKK